MKRRPASLWVLITCLACSAAPIHRSSDAPPAREPSNPGAAVDERENSKVGFVRLGDAGPVVGWLTSLEPLARSERRGGLLWLKTRFGVASEEIEPLYVTLPVSAAETVAFPDPQPALRTVYGHHVKLRLDDGRAFAYTGCFELQVMEEQSHRSRVRVEQDGVVLEGWVDGLLPTYGSAACPPRVLAAASDWPTLAPDEPLPDHYRQPEQFEQSPQAVGSLWWLQQPDAPCEEWRWLEQDGELVLEHRSDVKTVTYRAGIDGRKITLSGPAVRHSGGRWMQSPCFDVFQVVQADEAQWSLLHINELPLAYHEDDVEIWYRSAAACEAARKRWQTHGREQLASSGC